jgi:hypothetical protein
MDTKALTAALWDKDGGFSIDVKTGQSPQSGFMVSIYPEREQKEHILTFSATTLNQYITDNIDLLLQSGAFLGGWHDPDDDTVYLDVSVKTDNLVDAVLMARKHGQLAIYDIAGGTSINVAERGESLV